MLIGELQTFNPGLVKSICQLHLLLLLRPEPALPLLLIQPVILPLTLSISTGALIDFVLGVVVVVVFSIFLVVVML